MSEADGIEQRINNFLEGREYWHSELVLAFARSEREAIVSKIRERRKQIYEHGKLCEGTEERAYFLAQMDILDELALEIEKGE